MTESERFRTIRTTDFVEPQKFSISLPYKCIYEDITVETIEGDFTIRQPFLFKEEMRLKHLYELVTHVLDERSEDNCREHCSICRMFFYHNRHMIQNLMSFDDKGAYPIITSKGVRILEEAKIHVGSNIGHFFTFD